MSDCPSALALRLKISGKSLQESGDAGALKRAFRMACAKAATDFSNLAMVLTELAEDELELDALVATLDPSQVIFVIKGRDQDHGMALFDPAALSGLLEHVTTGRVSRGEIEPREPTNTDATIVAAGPVFAPHCPGIGRHHRPAEHNRLCVFAYPARSERR